MSILEFPVTLDEAGLEPLTRGLNAFSLELNKTAEKTGNAVRVRAFYVMDNPEKREISVSSQESVMERLSQDLKAWTVQLNQTASATNQVAQLVLKIKFYMENPDKMRGYVVLTADDAGQLHWVLQETPKIKKDDLDIKFKVQAEELRTKQKNFDELQEMVVTLTDPKWLSARMEIKGCALNENKNLVDAKHWCYIINK